ncbi:MAG: hypothetical protein JWM21_4956 [Acidobacteria bacterium]|nr:hypothetical protein [Acidobacteriota bacterium]
MREFRIFTIVLLGLALLGTVLANRKTSPQEQLSDGLQKSEHEAGEALAVVRKYISLSQEGKFEEIARITIAIPKGAQRKISSDGAASTNKGEISRGTITVAGPSPLLNRLDWIRQAFPKAILEDRDQIMKIGTVKLKDNLAKISINLGHDQRYSDLPWVFMMIKDGEGSSWKIYDINTPAYAADYNP